MDELKPYVGMIVLYTFPHSEIGSWSEEGKAGQEQTVPAIIVNVFSDDCVNLRTFPDSNGSTICKTSASRKNGHHNEDDGGYWDFIS